MRCQKTKFSISPNTVRLVRFVVWKTAHVIAIHSGIRVRNAGRFTIHHWGRAVITMELLLMGVEMDNLRARKLLDEGTTFIVVAVDQPYFLEVFKLIQHYARMMGRWTAGDQEWFDKAEREFYQLRQERFAQMDRDCTRPNSISTTPE
jgi:hypothetical protein